MLLSACGQVKSPPIIVKETEIHVLSPPDELVHCSERPAIPEVNNGQAIGGFILQLDAAWADCFYTLRELVFWMNEAKERMGK